MVEALLLLGGGKMAEVATAREQIAARKQQDYDAWQRYERAFAETRDESFEREASAEAPYKLACEVLGVDYADIQKHAQALIETHDLKPRGEWHGEYEDNARTAIFEALTASGHLSRIEMRGEPDDINEKTLQRWLNGMQPDLPDHELKRRFQEICEELIIQEAQRQILAGELPPDIEIATESTYVVGMSNEAAEQIGYRWRNKKGMIRSTGFELHEDGTVTRIVEQVNYSNSSAHDSILRRHKEGLLTPRTEEADIDLLGAQLIYSRSDLAEGVIGIQRRIDAFMGDDIRFGERVTDITPSYEKLREISAEREAHVEKFVAQLARLEYELDQRLRAGEITKQQHNQLYVDEVHAIKRAICILQPEYTRDALGEAVVEAYNAAHERMLRGDDSGAADIVAAVAGQEQETVICGMSNTTTPGEEQGNADAALRAKLSDIKENWQWSTGKCRVPNCPTLPNNTKVGPCQVCVSCQHMFDTGRDPIKLYAGRAKQQNAPASSAAPRNELRQAVPAVQFVELMGIGDAELEAYQDGVLVASGEQARQLRKQHLAAVR